MRLRTWQYLASPVLRVAAVGVVVALAGASCGGGGSTGSNDLRAGRSVYGDSCSSCHGRRGEGGVGPDLSQVLSTWPGCTDHQEWISLGSEGWKSAHGSTYGALDRPITKVMPAHADKLTTEEIAQVAAFERVEYGGGDADQVLADCGLASTD